MSRLTVGVALFPEFEILDAMGPVEMIGMHRDRFHIHMLSERGGLVASAQGPEVMSAPLADAPALDLLLIPGGPGTRRQVENPALLEEIARAAEPCRFVTAVCTGAALLARTGLLDGRRATTNKMSFAWVAAQGPRVDWARRARWVQDGRFWTSSGVSAGMDMALGLIAEILGPKAAEDAALWTEYDRRAEADHDPFADRWGLV